MKDLNEKRRCIECYWRGTAQEQLEAPNPFDPEENVVGCPGCKGVDTLRWVCDEEGCWEEGTCGTPTPDGYRTTCGKHIPKR